MNFKLSGTVRYEQKGYKPGDEEYLLQVLSKSQKADFIERGLLVPVMAEGAPLDDAPGFDEVSEAEVAASYISREFSIELSSNETPAQFVAGIVSDLRTLTSENETLKADIEKLKTPAAPKK